MRVAAILPLLTALALAGGCKSEEPAAEPAPTRASASPEGPAERQAEPPAEPEAEPAAEPKPDHERAAQLADLDDMCKAVDHDYVDGTLTDYYGDLKPRTAWGEAQRDAGDQSMQPGRLLEKAVAELSPGAIDPALPHCRKLLDYLDDVE